MSFKVEKDENIAFNICFKDFTRETVRKGLKILNILRDFKFD
jgi:hypothetical protein